MKRIDNRFDLTDHKEENNREIEEGLLQEIWDQIESIIVKTGRKTIPLKKISCKRKPILHNRGYTHSFKDLRELIAITSLAKKVHKSTARDKNKIEVIKKKISRIKKT